MSLPVQHNAISSESEDSQVLRLQKQVQELLQEKATLTAKNKELTDKNTSLEWQLKLEKTFVFFVSKTNADMVKTANDKNAEAEEHKHANKLLKQINTRLEKENESLLKENENLMNKVPQDPIGSITEESALSEIRDKLEILEKDFCRNRNEEATARYETLLKKVAVRRSKSWKEITNNIGYQYVTHKRRIDSLLKKIVTTDKPEYRISRFHRLLDDERREKDALWELVNRQLMNIDRVNKELFDSQEEVAELKNKNDFLKETSRLFRKRKREDDLDDENIPPSKK
ncbi:hypothetical protein K501DRAFT_269331 [Backusella circina FSU 941]|nr:hypothetical protein K501DRAFT_269331 [Backusella circina FSU 941]